MILTSLADAKIQEWAQDAAAPLPPWEIEDGHRSHGLDWVSPKGGLLLSKGLNLPRDQTLPATRRLLLPDIQGWRLTSTVGVLPTHALAPHHEDVLSLSWRRRCRLGSRLIDCWITHPYQGWVYFVFGTCYCSLVPRNGNRTSGDYHRPHREQALLPAVTGNRLRCGNCNRTSAGYRVTPNPDLCHQLIWGM